MFRLLTAPALGLVLVLAACGGSYGDSATSGGDDGAGMTLEITSPSDGADVSAPFTVKFNSSEELGSTDEGLHHVHVFWDGDDSEYTVVESDSVQVTDVPSPGEHELDASLRNADHSAAGVETHITVNVTNGGGGNNSGDNGGSGY